MTDVKKGLHWDGEGFNPNDVTTYPVTGGNVSSLVTALRLHAKNKLIVPLEQFARVVLEGTIKLERHRSFVQFRQFIEQKLLNPRAPFQPEEGEAVHDSGVLNDLERDYLERGWGRKLDEALQRCLDRMGVTLDEVREFVAKKARACARDLEREEKARETSSEFSVDPEIARLQGRLEAFGEVGELLRMAREIDAVDEPQAIETTAVKQIEG